MKNVKSIFIGLCVAVFFASCYKDKGNYDYIEINTITLSNAGLTYTVFQFDTLRISPSITQTLPVDEAELHYEWSMRKIDENDVSQSFPVTIISDQRDLNEPISLAPAEYKLIYKVTDPTTEVSSYLFYNVTVQTSFSVGWLVLQQYPQENKADVSMLVSSSGTTRFYHNLYESVNGVPLDPTTSRMDKSTVLEPEEYYFLSDNDGVEVDLNSFARIKSFEDWFFTAPTVIKPSLYRVMAPPTSSSQAGFMINNGKVHVKVYGGFPGDVKFGSEVLFQNHINYEMEPYFMIGTYSSSLYYGALFDRVSRNFVALKPAGSLGANLDVFPTPPSDAAFDPNNVGMDLVYAGNTGTNYLYSAILKDSNGDHYVYQLNLLNAQVASLKKKMNTGLSNATILAAENSRRLEYIYFAVNNKVYMYQIGANVTTEIFSFPASEQVTKLKIDTDYSATTLMAGTYDNSGGKLYSFTLADNGTFSGNTYTNVYSDLGKVVDIMYKAD